MTAEEHKFEKYSLTCAPAGFEPAHTAPEAAALNALT